jgi:ATPase subunit of ABC transporter with duplicated ATPase domains
MSAQILSVSNLSFEYPGSEQALFSELSFQLYAGSRTGLLGANGSGKTTLLRLLSQELELQTGSLYNSVPAVYLEQSGLAQDPKQLVFEVLLSFRASLASLWRSLHEQEYQGILDPLKYAQQVAEYADLEGYTYQAQAENMASQFGFVPCDLLRPLHSLSGGERRLLHLAGIFAAQPEFLLLDEPTHYLDQAGQAYLLQALQKTTATVLVVSHDRWFLDQCVNQILLLERGKVHLYKGNYSTFAATREAEALAQERQKAKLDREIGQLQEIQRHYKVWGNQREKTKHAAADSGFESARAARLQRRSIQAYKRLEQRIEELQSVRPWVEKNYTLEWQEPERSANVSLFVNKLKLPSGCTRPLSFQLIRGQKLALTGNNGSGKTTFLQILVEERSALAGSMHWGAGINWGYLPQFLPEHQTSQAVCDLFKPTQWGEARRVLGALKLKGNIFQQPLQQLSQGQQRKVALAELILARPHVLLLDEPSNHLDYESIEQLEKLLQDFPGSLILISHDRRLRENVVHSELCLD